MDKLEQAWQIAKTADVATPENSVVLYSISYLPTDENKQKAFAYIAKHSPSYMLDDTPCGKLLLELGLETERSNPDKVLMQIWAEASRRFILAASGNVTAFVQNADKRSTFVAVELPLILQNGKIKSINGINKFEFAEQFA